MLGGYLERCENIYGTTYSFDRLPNAVAFTSYTYHKEVAVEEPRQMVHHSHHDELKYKLGTL